MTKHTQTLFLALSIAALGLVGCDNPPAEVDAGPGTDAGPGSDGGPGEDAGPDVDAGPVVTELRGADNPPTPGTQIDRAGRAAITGGAIGTFMPPAMDTERAALKDDYNANADPTTWAAMYADGIAGNIAILDGLDEDCGNQLAFDVGGAGTAYAGLAGVLANDRLFVNADVDACDQYLGVEADVLGVDGTAGIDDFDCGGRTPTQDIMQRTYSVLVNGSLGDIDDGLGADNVTHSNTVFPFFAAP